MGPAGFHTALQPGSEHVRGCHWPPQPLLPLDAHSTRGLGAQHNVVGGRSIFGKGHFKCSHLSTKGIHTEGRQALWMREQGVETNHFQTKDCGARFLHLLPFTFWLLLYWAEHNGILHEGTRQLQNIKLRTNLESWTLDNESSENYSLFFLKKNSGWNYVINR